MNDITIILPIHIWNDEVKKYTEKAINSVVECQKNYKKGILKLNIVSADNISLSISNFMTEKKFDLKEYKVLSNKGNIDYCSQVNFGVDNVDTEFFSILEFDDTYLPKWFNQANRYYKGNEDVSIFLPINVTHDTNSNNWLYINEMVLAQSFSNEIGFIDFDCLENCSLFNLTGGIFNTNDFIKIGKYKPSIKLAFNYELLLRMTYAKLKIYVVPKEGYIHIVDRPGSLIDYYSKTIDKEDSNKYFELAKREYLHKEDRNKDISNKKEVELK